MKANFGIDFIGLDTVYMNIEDKPLSHTYLDSAASSLAMLDPYLSREKVMRHYANIHTTVSTPARLCTDLFEKARKNVIEYYGFSEDEYLCLFSGSGATSLINMFAMAISENSNKSDAVILSLMEHHSNDLPHRRFFNNIIYIDPQRDGEGQFSSIDLDALEDALKQNKVRYVAITVSSNVTGIVNPINQVAELAHKYGAVVLADASQAAAHSLYGMEPDHQDKVDAWIFAGHKIYAPGSPGVMIVKKGVLNFKKPVMLGGGIVSDVSKYNYTLWDDDEDVLQAGTPDFLGAIQISSVLSVLSRTGRYEIYDHEKLLTQYAIERLKGLGDHVYIYGSTSLNTERIGIVAFNIYGVDHELTASILNDYYCISVRNACFCAHPYVRFLLRPTFMNLEFEESDTLSIKQKQGMVRVSIGIYNTIEDIDAFITAIKDIIENSSFFKQQYRLDSHGRYKHMQAQKMDSLSRIIFNKRTLEPSNA